MHDPIEMVERGIDALISERKIVAAYCSDPVNMMPDHLIELDTGASTQAAFDRLLPAETPDGLLAYLIPLEGEAHTLLRRHPETGDEWQLGIDQPAMIIFTPVPPAGGGGGEGGSNPLQMVLMVAIMVLAVYTGGAAAGALGLTQGTGAAATLTVAGQAVAAGVTAAITIAGSLLLNALFPPPVPDREELTQGTTFNGQVSGQLAQQGQRIPEIFGRRRFPPLFLVQPYAEFRGDTNELFALYSVTAGKADIEKLEFEDTVIWTKTDGVLPAIKDLDIQICQPGEPITLFPINVISSSEPNGQKLRGPNEKETGETDEDLILGPYAVCPPGQVVDRISNDFQFPTGLGQQGANGAIGAVFVEWVEEARLIDDGGAPLGDGSWLELNNRRVTRSTLQPQRFSDTYVVERGRWEVRARRLTIFETSNTVQNLLTWTGLRGFQPYDRAFDHETVLALKFTGSAATQTARQLFVTATRILPDWDQASGTWIERPTQSIAAAFRHFAESEAYGRRQEHQIDLATLTDLQDQVWSPRGDTFNHRFTRELTVREHLNLVCRVGRARPLPIVQDLSLVRDQAVQIPEMHFGPQDIVRGTLKITRRHRTEEDPQAVRVNFTESTGAKSSVMCHLPGHDVFPVVDFDFPGIDNHPQAWREGITEVAAAYYRRRTISFSSYKRARPLLPMALVSLSLPRLRGSQTALLKGHDGTSILDLDQPITIETGEQLWAVLTTPTGTQFGPIKCVQAGDLAPVEELNGDQVMQARSIALDTDDLADYLEAPAEGRQCHADPFTWMSTEEAGTVPTGVSVGTMETVFHLAKVAHVEPGNDQIVPLTVVEYRPEVNEAENGPMPAAVAKLVPANTPTAPTWENVSVTITDSGSGPTLNISGPVQPGATTYHAAYTVDDQDRVELAPSAAPSFSVAIGQGEEIVVEYGAEGAGGRGPVSAVVAAIEHIVPARIEDADLNLTHDPDNTGSAFQWPVVFGATSYEIELLGDNDGSAHTLRRVLIVTTNNYDYTRAQQTEDGGPWRHAKLRVRPSSAGGAALVTERLAYDVPPPAVTGVAMGINSETTVTILFTLPTGDPTLLGGVVAFSESSGFDPNDPAIQRQSGDNPAAQGHVLTGLSAGRTYYCRLAAHDGCLFGLNWSNQITVFTDQEDISGP